MNEIELFVAAAAIPVEAEREAFLDARCAGDSTLRQRLARLLEAHFHSSPLLDSPTAPAAPPSDTEQTASERSCETPGTLIAGRYK
ncbi:MAG TPA: hypothetical protein VNC50_13870, partial [Planctomycetia bacterium]|nr:hypothetical protein [Planctomycetia bacterium]